MDLRADPGALLPFVERRYASFLATLATIVDIDSGTRDPAGVDRVGDICVGRLRAQGWAIERYPDGDAATRRYGDVVVARYGGAVPVADGGQRILLMGHTDTVFDPGTAATRPFTIDGPRAYGPGVADDKGGVVAGIEAFEVLLSDCGFDEFASLTFVLTPDEEVGSPSASDIIRRLATDADVALNLEAARATGHLVSARKGVADALIEVTGRAAHAGVEPDKGVNAALEAARTLVALQELNGRWPDVTVNVGRIEAGTRANVIADRARLHVEARAVDRVSFDAVLAEVAAIGGRSLVGGTDCTVTFLNEHPPMEKTPAAARLVGEAQEVARALGFEVEDTLTGGAADANTTAAAGVPTLDGLGPIGGDAHASNEWLDLESVVPRVALLAGLIARLGTTRL